MKRLTLILVAFWLTCAIATLSAEELRGKVVGITDGDTLVLLDASLQQHKVRLNGIDAPETDQAFGQVATRSLSNLVFGQNVVVVWNKVDRYGRIIGTVLVGTTDANLEQIRGGFAWFYREYANDVAPANRALYASAEADARGAKRGLWAESRHVPPWEFRNPTRGVSSPAAGSAASAVEVRGNIRSRIYHVPGCHDYDNIAPANRVLFKTESEATAAGYRKAKNCR